MLSVRRMYFRAVTVINIAACYALIIEVHSGCTLLVQSVCPLVISKLHSFGSGCFLYWGYLGLG